MSWVVAHEDSLVCENAQVGEVIFGHVGMHIASVYFHGVMLFTRLYHIRCFGYVSLGRRLAVQVIVTSVRFTLVLVCAVLQCAHGITVSWRRDALARDRSRMLCVCGDLTLSAPCAAPPSSV